jgi:hypothetical protein
VLYRAATVLAGILVGVLVVEGGIRLFPGLLSRELQHLAFSRYNLSPSGMYVLDRPTRTRFMRSNFRTHTFSHGYWWTHRSDELGFRNPPGLARREVLLLGDSMIYGHGVEEEQTLAHFLRTDHGVAAYDMSRAGGNLYESYVRLRLYADELRPRAIILFVFVNDFRDLENKRTAAELDNPPEIHTYDYEEMRARVGELQRRRSPWPIRAAHHLASVRLVANSLDNHLRLKRRGKWARLANQSAAAPKQRDSGAPMMPTDEATAADLPRPRSRLAAIEDTRAVSRLKPVRERGKGVATPILAEARFRPLARYYDLALTDLKTRCAAWGSKFALVHLYLQKPERGPRHEHAQQVVRDTLKATAERLGVPFFDTRDLFAGCDDCCLPRDGHFTEAGHRRLAEFIDNKVLASQEP